MSIGTYAELQTAIGTWLHNSSTYSALIPDWITAAENRLNDELMLTAMQAQTTLTCSTSTRFLDLPSRHNGPISLYLTISGVRIEVVNLTPQELAARLNTIAASQPRYFTIGSQLEFDCTPNSTYSLTYHYYKKLALATDLTNFLLTSNYKAYLYGALIEAYTYKEDDAKVQRYEALLQAELDRLQENDNANRSIIKTRVDSMLTGNRRGSILLG